MSTLLFELRRPACCENNSPIPSSDLYPNTICEKCFTANFDFPFKAESIGSIFPQQHVCRLCGDIVTKSIYTRSHSYPMLVLSLKEVLNLLRFRNPSYVYKDYGYNNTVVKISLLVMDGIAYNNAADPGGTESGPITANLTFMPETRRPFVDRLSEFKKRNSDVGFSMEDLIGLGLVNSLQHKFASSRERPLPPAIASAEVMGWDCYKENKENTND